MNIVGKPLRNFSLVRDRLIAVLGSELFEARYPNVSEWLKTHSPSADDPVDLPALFSLARSDIPRAPDVADSFLMQMIRLDLQHAGSSEQDFSYLDPGSELGQEVRGAIGTAMNLPFIAANYLCHLSNTFRFLYVATPKVACTALKHQLQQLQMDGRLAFDHYGQEHLPVLSPLLAPLDQPQLFFEAVRSDNWFRFTFVREPFGRVLSCYLDKIVRSVAERNRMLPRLGLDPAAEVPSFVTFLRAVKAQAEQDHDFHWAPQSWLTQPDSMNYHFIGRLEQFKVDLAHIAGVIGFEPQVTAPLHSTDASAKLLEFYGEEEVELAKSIYREDFNRFGYDPELLSPGQITPLDRTQRT